MILAYTSQGYVRPSHVTGQFSVLMHRHDVIGMRSITIKKNAEKSFSQVQKKRKKKNGHKISRALLQNIYINIYL